MTLQNIHNSAIHTPDKIAVVIDGQSYSYAQFYEMIYRTREHLSTRNMPESGSVLIIMPSLLDAWLACFAARSLGHSTLVVNAPSVTEGLDLRDIRAIITQSAQQTAALAAYLGIAQYEVPELRVREKDITRSGHEKMTLSGDHHLLTSGSTGTRKRVALPASLEDLRNTSWANQLNFSSETWLGAAYYPLFTGAGFLKPCATWSVGGAVILSQDATGLKALFTWPATSVILAPSVVKPYLDAFIATGSHKADFKLHVAGGFFSLKTMEKLVRTVHKPIDIYYASSELGAISLRSSYASLEDLIWFSPTGSREIIVIDDSGKPCPDMVEGEVRIKTTEIDSSAYWNDPASSETIFKDGYFIPGDMAMRRPDGRIRILGRTNDVLVVQGFKMAVAPIEQQIRDYLGVEEVCVFSRSTDKGAEELLVAVRSKRPVAEARQRHIANMFKAFEIISFFVMPKFPLRSGGLSKTDRQTLRAMLN